MPGLEMRCLGGPDAEQNPQDFDFGHSLSQRRIEAAATLLNSAEVKARGESDRLEMVRDVKGGNIGGAVQVIVGSGNCCTIDDVLGLTKYKVGIEIGVVVVAAIAGPEAGVDVEVHQIGEPSDVGGT